MKRKGSACDQAGRNVGTDIRQVSQSSVEIEPDHPSDISDSDSSISTSKKIAHTGSHQDREDEENRGPNSKAIAPSPNVLNKNAAQPHKSVTSAGAVAKSSWPTSAPGPVQLSEAQSRHFPEQTLVPVRTLERFQKLQDAFGRAVLDLHLQSDRHPADAAQIPADTIGAFRSPTTLVQSLLQDKRYLQAKVERLWKEVQLGEEENETLRQAAKEHSKEIEESRRRLLIEGDEALKYKELYATVMKEKKEQDGKLFHDRNKQDEVKGKRTREMYERAMREARISE